MTATDCVKSVKNVNSMKGKVIKVKSRGLGDTIEKFTSKTGIKKVVKAVAGEDCGCDKRRDTLNRIFPYKK
tara:strand:+ start:845 stop:1057 length:213 start_codon:yes stop_codon:yes gene_type:complete